MFSGRRDDSREKRKNAADRWRFSVSHNQACFAEGRSRRSFSAQIKPASPDFGSVFYYSSAILTAVSSAISIIWVKLLWRSSAVRLSSGR